MLVLGFVKFYTCISLNCYTWIYQNGYMDFLNIRKCSFAQKGIYNSGEVGGSTECCWWPSNVGKRQRLATQPGRADFVFGSQK